MKMEWKDPKLWFLWTLLYHNRQNLTHLSLRLPGIDDAPLEPFLDILQDMVQLQHLTVRTSFQSENWFLSMLEQCLPLPRLSELFCHFYLDSGTLSSWYDEETDDGDRYNNIIATPTPAMKYILDRAIKARTSPFTGSIGVKIKALRFPDPENENVDLIRLVLPMLKSDLVDIETLEVPRLLDQRPEKLYKQMVRVHCPALRHLILPSYDEVSCVPNHFIEAATGLKTVRGFSFNDEFEWFSRNMMQMVAKHHSKTLEEVDLMLCRMINGRDQQALFASCTQLKRFWMVPDGMSTAEQGIEFKDILTGAWRCLGMKELSITLNRSIVDVKATFEAMRQEGLKEAARDGHQAADETYRVGDKDQKRRATAWAAKQALTQIGRLTALEHLALGTDEGPYGTDNDVLESKWDLTLSKGWLAQLAGLKNLRQFHMRTDHWSYMGQAEVEFMDAEWPWLDCVTFDRCSMSKQQFGQEISLPHWQWLQQKRPSLRLSVIHMDEGVH
ncbi:hypothetical protein BGZ70_003499 [Mortierella alpina]|uniref:Uncharacterized protein n=1 Tax=Mortierella alpina TaxID=64518 RepID=A0A9P6ISU1_MORAP|nr:hypothetical protein BGZ70_003499 [Mortierella alpina]